MTIAERLLKYQEERLGEKVLNRDGYWMTIITYRGSDDCDIEFDDGTIVRKVTYRNFQKAGIKNPNHPNVQGRGYIGQGKYSQGTHPKIHSRWSGIMNRCYGKNSKDGNPTYKICSVCAEWYNFQNFAKWFEENYNPEYMDSWELDKDILIKGNKIYSPKTCCFVPPIINVQFTRRESCRGKYPIGVIFNKKGNVFEAWCTIGNISRYLGKAHNTEETFYIYKPVKETEIQRLANEWKSLITEPCYQALMNYQVEITD